MSAATPDEGHYRQLQERVRVGLIRLADVPVPGESTSPIEADNKFLLDVPIYQPFQDLVRVPLHSALDNLGLVAETLNAIGAQHLYAEKSLIRTSLTAAAWALWMLDDDDPKKRRSRVLRFAFKDIDGLVSYFQNDPAANGPMGPEFFKAMDVLQGRIVNCANDLEDENRDVDKYRRSRTGHSDTAVVKSAGCAIGAADLLKTWQFMSGYAHALPWAALVSAIETPIENRVHGLRIPTHTPNPAQLLAASDFALTVIERAIGRFEILSRVPA